MACERHRYTNPTFCPVRDQETKDKARVAEIDKMFEEATGWGSWMVTAANEREDLATKYGWPQKCKARCGGERTD